jgi:hypothetical protein
MGGLGFVMENSWCPDGVLRWCMLRLNTVAIMVQPDRPQETSPGKGGGVVFCIFCDDAVALYHQFVAQGVQPEEPFVGNNLWVTSVTNPDGHRLDFESPTDAPEETRLPDLRR